MVLSGTLRLRRPLAFAENRPGLSPPARTLQVRRAWNPDAIEAELAHADSNQVRRIYHRALYWEERVRMADWWADKVLAMAQAL
jgi:hypothetical protein